MTKKEVVLALFIIILLVVYATSLIPETQIIEEKSYFNNININTGGISTLEGSFLITPNGVLVGSTTPEIYEVNG